MSKVITLIKEVKGGGCESLEGTINSLDGDTKKKVPKGQRIISLTQCFIPSPGGSPVFGFIVRTMVTDHYEGF